jgi:hypothetical protein
MSRSNFGPCESCTPVPGALAPNVQLERGEPPDGAEGVAPSTSGRRRRFGDFQRRAPEPNGRGPRHRQLRAFRPRES